MHSIDSTRISNFSFDHIVLIVGTPKNMSLPINVMRLELVGSNLFNLLSCKIVFVTSRKNTLEKFKSKVTVYLLDRKVVVEFTFHFIQYICYKNLTDLKSYIFPSISSI